MADNITVPGTGEALAFDEIAGVKHQRVKVQHGADGSATDVSAASPLPVLLDAAALAALETTELGATTLAALETITIGTALPAGTNNIGDVDVLTEPATAADNAASLPAVVKVVGGWDGTNVQALKTNADGTVVVANSPTSFSTPLDGCGAVVVGTSSAVILAANGARVEATICNDHSTNVVYLALEDAAVSGQGVRLNAAGGSYTTPPGYKGAVNAIATGAGTNVCFVEA